MPPAPTVSCPSTPSSSATRSSMHPAVEAADPDRGEHEVRAGQRLVEVGGGGRPPAASATSVGLLGEHAADRRQPGGVEVVQHHVGDPALGAVGQQRPVDQRHAEAAAAEDGEPHRPRLTSHVPPSPQSAARVVARASRVARVGDHDVEVLRAAHPGHAGAGELADVGDQHDLVARRDHRALDRHLDHRRVHDLAVGPHAAGAEEQPVGVDLAQVVLGQEADQRAVARAAARRRAARAGSSGSSCSSS